MFDILKAYSIRDQIVLAIGSMYHGVTYFFATHAGVLQGNNS